MIKIAPFNPEEKLFSLLRAWFHVSKALAHEGLGFWSCFMFSLSTGNFNLAEIFFCRYKELDDVW